MGLFSNSFDGHGDSLQDWLRYQVSKLNGNLNNTIPSSAIRAELSVSMSTILSSVVGLFFAWFLGSCIWYRYLSPISDIPGPFLASFSRLWLIKVLIRGRGAIELADLHETHGE